MTIFGDKNWIIRHVVVHIIHIFKASHNRRSQVKYSFSVCVSISRKYIDLMFHFSHSYLIINQVYYRLLSRILSQNIQRKREKLQIHFNIIIFSILLFWNMCFYTLLFDIYLKRWQQYIPQYSSLNKFISELKKRQYSLLDLVFGHLCHLWFHKS